MNMHTGEITGYLYSENCFDVGLLDLVTEYYHQTDYRATSNSYYTYPVQVGSSTVLVDGEPVSFEVYNIGNNNYFKLRDLAAALDGTQAQFNVTWDNEKSAVNILSNQGYTAVGGELTPGDGTNKDGYVSNSPIYLNGFRFVIDAIVINGNNFVKLRDLAEILDFGVSWDSATGAVLIESAKSYSAT